MEYIKPCPFCSSWTLIKKKGFIECGICGARGPLRSLHFKTAYQGWQNRSMEKCLETDYQSLKRVMRKYIKNLAIELDFNID